MKAARNGMAAILVLLAIALLAAGCGKDSDVTSPATNQGHASFGGKTDVFQRHVWGMWKIEIDSETLEPVIIPVRRTNFTANVLLFMQPPMSPTHMLSIAIDPAESDIPNNLFAVDVTLRHPFPGLSRYRGFDVRGVFMSDASQAAGFDQTARYANWFKAAPGVPATESVLLNADGYTRWWNPGEFTTYGTIFGHIPGGLATPGYTANATVNPFKCFADELDAKDEFNLNPANRGTYGVNPGVNTRRYLIQFDGSPLRFNYAVDASWAEPDESYAPEYPIEAFGEAANCQEAYRIKLTDAGSTAWYESESSNGGAFLVDVEVFDWQAVDSSTVIDEIARIWVESPAFDDGSGNNYMDILSGAYTVLPGSNYTSAIFRAEIEPDFSSGGIDEAGDYPVFIAVESAEPDTYEPQIPGGGGGFAWPNAPLTAFNVGTVEVSDESPTVPVLVLEDEIAFPPVHDGYDCYSPAVIVENDGDVVIVYDEWTDNGPPNASHQTYASALRSHDDGDSWPDYNWCWRVDSSWHGAGDATKIWPSNNGISYRTGNMTDAWSTQYLTGHAASTFRDGPNGHEAANGANQSIDNANEILQDSDGYVYVFGDPAGTITFKRSEVPECLNCGPNTFMWSNFPTYTLVSPGRLSRVRSSALHDGKMCLAYFEPDNDLIKLAYETAGWQNWDTSTVVWDAKGSDAHSPRDPGLHLDETGFYITFVRTDYLTGFNELCFTKSNDGSDWTEPLVIRANVFKITDNPICRYDWDGTSVLAVVWWEGDQIWASFSIDDGETWADRVLLSEASDLNRHADMIIAPTDNWHIVFGTYDTSSGLYEIHYRRAHLEWE